jgi:hypothetical protein|tara:strand:+ start:4228 stop:6951 length:2724 start_codon:yes stop_codon:yes gene_type:complete
MPDSDPSPQLTPIPKELKKQLAEFQRQLWRTKIVEAILAGFFGLIISFLVVFVLDRFIATPPLARLGILIAGTSLFAIFAPLMMRRWIYGHRKEGQLARLISKKFPKLGDRLLGVVELQDQKESHKTLSPELRAAAMAHVARQVGKKDMGEALPISHYKKLGLGVALGALCVILGFSFAPKAGSNALKRWLLPLSGTERYTFTQLDLSGLPNPYTVPYDEPFVIIVPLKEETDDRPAIAAARYGLQDWLETDLSEKGYRFEFQGQQSSDVLTLRVGDALHRIRIEPEIRPELTALDAKVTLPAYLQLETKTIDIRSGTLSALAGSKIELEGTFSRDLKSATGTVSALPPDDEVVSTFEEASETETEQPAPLPDPTPLELTIFEDRITSSPIELGEFRVEIPLQWTDVKGLESSTSFNLKIQTAHDQAPLVYTQGIERQIVILAGETLEFEVLTEDDYGIQEIGLMWQGEFTKPTDESPASGELLLKQGSPSNSRLSELAIFSPKTHGIVPQKLTLVGYAQDFKPERERSLSEPIIIYILTEDEHAQLLKQRFDRLIGELEDAARREQNNLDTNERLDQLNKPEDLQNEENKEKLAQQEDAEDQNAEKMEEITKKMEELFKDAARNKSIEKETMKKMADSLQNMKELAKQDLPEIEKKLNESQDNKSTPEKAKKDLQEAIEKQKEALKKMQETIKKANEANNNFEASTFINRLKRAASDEDGISNKLVSSMTGQNSESKKAATPLLGAAAESDTFDPVFRRMIEMLGTQQRRTGSDVNWIQEDLANFYARTQKEIHKEIVDDMKKSEISLKLEGLQTRISKNRSFTAALEAKKWGAQLREWAKKLEGTPPDAAGGDGGGEGGANPEEKDFEFMLKVMRMVQAEQDIRSRTRSLEQLMRSVELRKAGQN